MALAIHDAFEDEVQSGRVEPSETGGSYSGAHEQKNHCSPPGVILHNVATGHCKGLTLDIVRFAPHSRVCLHAAGEQAASTPCAFFPSPRGPFKSPLRHVRRFEPHAGSLKAEYAMCVASVPMTAFTAPQEGETRANAAFCVGSQVEGTWSSKRYSQPECEGRETGVFHLGQFRLRPMSFFYSGQVLLRPRST